MRELYRVAKGEIEIEDVISERRQRIASRFFQADSLSRLFSNGGKLSLHHLGKVTMTMVS